MTQLQGIFTREAAKQEWGYRVDSSHQDATGDAGFDAGWDAALEAASRVLCFRCRLGAPITREWDPVGEWWRFYHEREDGEREACAAKSLRRLQRCCESYGD